MSTTILSPQERIKSALQALKPPNKWGMMRNGIGLRA
jgi:hypothetical protein